MEDRTRKLCELLSKAGAVVSFSKDCVSGLVGGMCRCWRCRAVAPDEQEPGWERVARLVSKGHEAELFLEIRIARSKIDVVGSQPSSQETANQNPGNGEPYAPVRGN